MYLTMLSIMTNIKTTIERICFGRIGPGQPGLVESIPKLTEDGRGPTP